MKSITIVLFSLIILGPCKNQEKAGTSEKPVDTQNQQENKYHLVVSFTSIGMGIDWELHKKFSEEYLKSIDEKVTYDLAPWGREGEKDYCFNLNGLKEKERVKFIKTTSDYVANGKWVTVEKQAECIHKNWGK